MRTECAHVKVSYTVLKVILLVQNPDTLKPSFSFPGIGVHKKIISPIIPKSHMFLYQSVKALSLFLIIFYSGAYAASSGF